MMIFIRFHCKNMLSSSSSCFAEWNSATSSGHGEREEAESTSDTSEMEIYTGAARISRQRGKGRLSALESNIKHSEDAFTSPAAQSPDDTARIAELQQRVSVQQVLENGLPSLQPRRGEGRRLQLHPVMEVTNISAVEFQKRFATTFGEQPVKITHSQFDWFRPPEWTLEALNASIGHYSVFQSPCSNHQRETGTNCHFVKEQDIDLKGTKWASLKATNLTELDISTYSDLFEVQISLAEQHRYLYGHEISAGGFPELTAAMYQPKYFLNNDYIINFDANPEPEQMLRQTHYPALFIGPAGSSSPLHSDKMMTRPWMIQLCGRKLVRLMPTAENQRSNATDADSFQPALYSIDLMNPDFDTYPGLDGMFVYEVLLEPGDILYIPGGWPHQALNLEWNVMSSSNFIDHNSRSNLDSFYRYNMDADAQFFSLLEQNSFYRPLVNAEKATHNIPLREFLLSHALEVAPVSDAARGHIQQLKRLGIPPSEWRDRFSRPVLGVAILENYVSLARWLVEQGVLLDNSPGYRALLKQIEGMGNSRMAEWMRSEMQIPANDDLSDITLGPPEG